MRRYRSPGWLATAWLLGMLAGWAVAHGQVAVKPEHPNRRAESSIDSPADFDDWALGGKAGAKRIRDHLERLLRKKIDEVEQMFVLTAAQRQKLKLAGHGDIKRLLDTVEDARREFELAKRDADRLNEVRKHLRTLDVVVSYGPFELGSLFDKTLRKMLFEQHLVRRSPREKKLTEGA
jgi:hypothetical protein